MQNAIKSITTRRGGSHIAKVLTQRFIQIQYQFLFIICLLQLHKGIYITERLTSIRKHKMIRYKIENDKNKYNLILS